MDNIFGAIFRAIMYLIIAAFYVFVVFPLGILCFVLSIALIPLDIITYALSLGSTRFEIMKSFQSAGTSCIKWYVEVVKDFR